MASFNGAATCRSRIDVEVDEAKRTFRALQWGRDLSVADRSSGVIMNRHWASRFNGAATCRSRIDPDYQTKHPAISLLQWGRDLSVADSGRGAADVGKIYRFNGAATCRSRIAVKLNAWQRRRRRVLQWGRDLSVADSGRGSCSVVARGSASMGPRPVGRG